MAQHAQDDGFHEIQLNGKQLVFVFMAATVVSVVIFLCGVLVGRGVRGERPETAQVTTESADQQLQSAINPEKPPTVQQNEDPTKAPPPAPAEGGTSGEVAATGTDAPVVTAGAAPLVANVAKSAVAAPEKPSTPEKAAPAASAAAAAGVAAVATAARAADLKAADSAMATKTAPPAAKPVIVANPPASRTASNVAAAAAPVASPREAAPSAGVPAPDDPQRGWVVQVAATKTRAEADTIAKRLSSRGYAAFVLSNSANVFRVRVGGYKNRKDADSVAARLKTEERVSPWVTR